MRREHPQPLPRALAELDRPAESASAPRSPGGWRSPRRWILVGCGAALLVFGIVAAALLAGLVYLGQDPPGVAVTIEGPSSVRVGEEFTLSIVIENQRSDRDFELSDLDLADAYLEGFEVIGTDPPATGPLHVPIDDTLSWSFDRAIAPGEVERFDFRMRATAAGLHRGSVDVCEGPRFLTVRLATDVHDDD